MQPNIESQTKVLELEMKLESSPTSDGTAGMVQIQSQLDNLMMQLQNIKKGKESQEDLWCKKYRMDGHTKDNCLTYMNYIASGAPNPLSAHGLPWCRICLSRGHHDKEILYLQNFVSTPANLFCKLCKLVGHEEMDYRAYRLLKENTILTPTC